MRVLWRQPALWHRARRAHSPLLDGSFRTADILNRVHDQLAARGDRQGIDAEWLVDNFHIIEDSLREVRRDLPPGYDELLPKLAVPPLVGYPRVYALALALVAHTDSELDETRIARFVRAFQEVAPLTIGELWALPTMLRLVLLENLRRLAEQMVWGWDERRRAERWAKSATDVHERPIGRADGQRAEPASLPASTDLSDPFVVRLLQLLRDQGPAVKALEQLEAELAGRGSDPNEVLRREHRRQAANQVTVGNCVLSLRLLSAVDWNAFFEQSQPGRGDPPRGPVGGLPAPGLRHQRPVPPGGRDDRPGVGQPTRSRWRGERSSMARRGRGSSEPRRPRRLLPDRPRPGGAEGGLRVSPRLARAPARLGAGPAGMGLLRLDRAVLGALMTLVVALALGGVGGSWWVPRARRGLAAAALRAGGRAGQPAA